MKAAPRVASLAHLGLLSLLVAGCSAGGAFNPSSATLNVAVMDAPFSLSGQTVSAVNIAVEKVELIGSGGHGPQVLATYSPAKVINLLDYQTTPLTVASAAIPAGVYQQLRFVLDTSSNQTTITVNGTTYPLSIPSATAMGFGGNTSVDGGDGIGTAGVKVNAHFTAQGGFTYGWLIDWNAAESILEPQPGQFVMKPVLVATVQATSGAIAGTVTNSSNGNPVQNAEVVAEQGGVVINSGITDSSGHYQINALAAGTYTLVVNNTYTTQAGQTVTAVNGNGAVSVTDPNSVTVTNGQVTQVNIAE